MAPTLELICHGTPTQEKKKAHGTGQNPSLPSTAERAKSSLAWSTCVNHPHTDTHTPRVEPKMADLTNSGGDTMGQNEVYIVIYTVVYWNVG